MQTSFVNGWYQITLDDGSVIAKSGRHCMQPRLVNGFVIYTGVEPNNFVTVAHELTTGTDYELPYFSGKNEFQTDGRFVLLLTGFQIGSWLPINRDLVGGIFDTVQKTWLSFTDSLVVSGGHKDNILWIKKGSGVSVTPDDPPNNPPGLITAFQFAAPGLVKWSTMSLNSDGVPALDTMFPDRTELQNPFKLWQRTVDITNGAMGAIEKLAESKDYQPWL